LRDVVVIGVLEDVQAPPAGETGRTNWEGSLRVEDVLWGSVAPGDILLLRWTRFPHDDRHTPSDHDAYEGLPMIWLLKYHGEYYGAMGTDRLSTDGREEVAAALARAPVVVGIQDEPKEDWELKIPEFCYRNCTRKRAEFPGISFDGEVLKLSPEFNVELSVTRNDSVVRPYAERVVYSSDLPSIAVDPMSEHCVELNIAFLFPLERATRSAHIDDDGSATDVVSAADFKRCMYRLRVSVDGHGPPHSTVFALHE